MALGILVNKHNMKKDKYDLLIYFTKNKDKLSITLRENGKDTIALNSEKKIPLASTMKIIVAYNFVKSVTKNKMSITDHVELNRLERFYIANKIGRASCRERV